MSKVIKIPTCRNPFKLVINNTRYSYPAGAEVEVPDEVAEAIQHHVDSVPKPDPNAGSSGGSPEGGGASSGGKPNVKEKDVNFYDYDGTLLHSYTVEEAQALSELPELPTQEGLICQGWNWSLEDIKEHNRAVDVGATYITDDGKTRLYIKIAAEGRMDVPLYFSQTVANGVTVDWGDGSATETLSGTGNVNTTHTYASIGEYVISLDVADGCTISLGRGSSSYCVMGSTMENGVVYCNMLQKVEIGNGLTNIGNYAFFYCYSLTSVTIPDSVTNMSTHVFWDCTSIASIIIPNSVTTIGAYIFNGCKSFARIIIPNEVTMISNDSFADCASIASIVIPNGVTSLGNNLFKSCTSLAKIVLSKNATNIPSYAFGFCSSLASVTIPNSVKKIENNAFFRCVGMKFYDFSQHESVPTLGGKDAFYNIPSDCEIRVPAALVDEWKAATNWSTYADKIVGV